MRYRETGKPQPNIFGDMDTNKNAELSGDEIEARAPLPAHGMVSSWPAIFMASYLHYAGFLVRLVT